MAETQVPFPLRRRLQTKLKVTSRQVYRLIAKIGQERLVSSRGAAFLLARQHGISFAQYATADDRAEMRGHPATVTAVGKPAEEKVQPELRRTTAVRSIKVTKNNSIFVVHGRDEALRRSMFELLRAFDINPIEWSEAIAKAKGANPNIGQVIDNAMKQVQGVLVMFSPDEQAKLKPKFCKPHEQNSLGKLNDQSRPNVIFEAGLALGAHPQKTLLVQVGEMRELSDIAGKHILRLSNDPGSRNELANRLRRKLKFKVNTNGQDWTKAGDFKR